MASKFYLQILAFRIWWRKVVVEADSTQMTI